MVYKDLILVKLMIWLFVCCWEFIVLCFFFLVFVVNWGDLIGCMVKFDMEFNGKVLVVFFLNGV